MSAPTAARPPRPLRAAHTVCPWCFSGQPLSGAYHTVERPDIGTVQRRCLAEPEPSKDDRTVRVIGTALGIVIFLACASCVVAL